MTCSNCGTDNRAGRKFCSQCGTPLAFSCPRCGASNEPEDRFCGECGSPLTGTAAPGREGAPAPAAPTAERRLVSVLFADLVGFTAISEQRDAEEVRELLSRYFDTCRRLIALYGGTVEKFIGDAVMAVWGTPVAQEDDAERAVRTALDLVDAVANLGQEIGATDLKARAGVLTGEAAVTLGAEGEGMVAGDLVNTASRIQAAAEPGAVLVGEATRRATEAAIVYEDAGSHDLKGKTDQVSLFRAIRVVAGRGGALKSSGLEAPFVGRDRELRLVKELFHASAEERKPHLVLVSGIAGIGKSRLAWEFYKYIDGLADTVWWHRGRCLAYGEGVTYWALAEMVRMRCGIVEGEDAASAWPKLRETIQTHVSDPEERRWVEPRLAHLLGLEERTATEREDLYAAWRLFFERLSEENPTAMVFEDMQWADAALLDFIEYLLEWSRSHPLFVLTLARPELTERHPHWAAGRRSFTSLHLEPLSESAMHQLLQGLVPGLPDELQGRILDRAQGVPLYAVETVRMLLDRGLLVQEDSRYRPVGPIEALEVPETLHALIAARLDGLEQEERRLMQDASVLGKTFTVEALSATTGMSRDQLRGVLGSLIRKEVLSLQADPRSPERGQYGFLQDLVRQVAYDTLSRRERKAKHLAVAAYLEQTWGPADEEVVEVVASHYLDAYNAVPDAPDASQIKARARDMLARAGEHAASLAATEEAQRYFEKAADLADEQVVRAELYERAGRMALRGGRLDQAEAHFMRSLELFEKEGRSHPAGRVSARLGEVEWLSGRLDEAVQRMEAALRVLVAEEPDEDLAALAVELGRAHFFRGDLDGSTERVETALDAAERLWLPEVISQALNTKGLVVGVRGHLEEGLGLVSHALKVALENGIHGAALRAYGNAADMLGGLDRNEEALALHKEALPLARRVGDRFYEWNFLSEMTAPLLRMGRWDEAMELAGEIPEEAPPSLIMSYFVSVAEIYVARGQLDEAGRLLDRTAILESSADVQEQGVYNALRAIVMRARGRHAEALSAGRHAFEWQKGRAMGHQSAKIGFVEGMEASLAMDDRRSAEQLLAVVTALPPGEQPPYLRAQAHRFRARLPSGPTEDAEQRFKGAAGMFRELGTPFWLAVTLLEHGEWLVAEGRSDHSEPLLAEAGRTFDQLMARPWLERLELVTGAVPAPR